MRAPVRRHSPPRSHRRAGAGSCRNPAARGDPGCRRGSARYAGSSPGRQPADEPRETGRREHRIEARPWFQCRPPTIVSTRGDRQDRWHDASVGGVSGPGGRDVGRACRLSMPCRLRKIRAGVATISSGASPGGRRTRGRGQKLPGDGEAPSLACQPGGLATAANDVALARPEELVDLARRSGRFDDYEVSHRTPASVTDPGRAQASAGRPGSRSGTAAAKRRKRGHALTRASAICSP